jgi:gamma-glutamyltranspeptidase/glutathione hydrolase
VVAAGHRESARAGAEILSRGGNAVDAACAAACAAAVAEAPLTGPGAGGFLLARSPEGEVTALDFFVAAPGLGPDGKRLTPEMLDSFTVPFGGAEQVFHIGPASVAVPGMVHGLAESVAVLGRLTLTDVVEPAVRLARGGVVVTPETAYLHEILTAMLTHTPESAALFAPDGRVRRAGESIRMPELAETFTEIGRLGVGVMLDGSIGQGLVELADAGGLVTREDRAAYAPIHREALEVRYRDVSVLTNPPPSSGGALIAAALHAIGPDGVSDDVGFYRTVASAGVAANALRDDAFLEHLREPGFVDELLARIGASRKPTGTTHVSVIDADGGMASLSSSCGSGGGVVLDGTGVLLNNMLGEEDLNPGGFGRYEPGTRMTSMMAPTLIVRGGEPLLAIGSAGSNRLRSAILQTVVSIIDGNLGLSEAIERPRIHPEGGGIDVEAGVPDAAIAALAADGHGIRRWGERNLFFGGVSAAGSEAHGLGGAGDPRRGGAAAGVTAAGEVIDL